MDDRIRAIAEEELKELNNLIDVLRIPDDVCRDCLSSGFFTMVYQSAVSSGEAIHAEDKAELESACARFDRLCNAVPNVNAECLRMLSAAYTNIALLFSENRHSNGISDDVSMLVSSATAKGAAIALLPPSSYPNGMADKAEQERRKNLAIAGAKGARVRNQPYEAIKKWAIEKSQNMRGDDRTIAKDLAGKLPEHLADKSDDPVRFIYDTLRGNRTRKMA